MKTTSIAQLPDFFRTHLRSPWISETKADPMSTFEYLFERIQLANQQLDFVDPQKFDYEDQQELQRCKNLLAGFVVGVLEMTDEFQGSYHPIYNDVQFVIDDFCDNVQTSLLYMLNPKYPTMTWRIRASQSWS